MLDINVIHVIDVTEMKKTEIYCQFLEKMSCFKILQISGTGLELKIVSKKYMSNF